MGSRIARTARAVGTAAAVVALAPAAAPASWTEPLLLSGAGRDANSPHVAMDRDGDAVAVWNRVDETFFNRIEARPRTAAGAWGAVQTPLSPGGQHAVEPRVALDGDGDGLIVWVRSDGSNTRIQARTRSRTGALGPVQTLSQADRDAEEPRVAVDDDGDAVVSWIRSDATNTRVQARTRTAAGVWSAVTTLSGAGGTPSGRARRSTTAATRSWSGTATTGRSTACSSGPTRSRARGDRSPTCPRQASTPRTRRSTWTRTGTR